MLDGITLTASSDTGLALSHPSGPVRLAVADADGKVLDSSDEFAAWVFDAVTEATENFWRGEGHLKSIRKI